MKVKNGGWGLTAINHINKIQMVNNIVDNAWNREYIPRRLNQK
jgi:hypothetical protein